MTKHTYTVIVGNIGEVYYGCDLGDARRVYAEYRDQSRREYGRAAGKDVTLLSDGNIVVEYGGTNISV